MAPAPELKDVVFYAFSTIAATFGSAVGLIAAAVIFRMQRIDQILSRLTELLNAKAAIEHRAELVRIAGVQDWKKYRRRWRETHRDNRSDEEDNWYWLIEKHTDRILLIRTKAMSVIGSTLFLIGVCFAALAATSLMRITGIPIFAGGLVVIGFSAIILLSRYYDLLDILTQHNDYDKLAPEPESPRPSGSSSFPSPT